MLAGLMQDDYQLTLKLVLDRMRGPCAGAEVATLTDGGVTRASYGQVAGRVEISTGGLLRRGEDAGVDVMGDGTFVAFAGGMRRTELDPGRQGPFEAVRRALS